MWREYSGPSWSRFARALAEYGLTVISSWCRSGKIFVECARKGCGLSPGEISGDDVLGLAGETVAVAIHKFRENVLIPRKWRPDKGASLKTFFIGQCVFRFPNIYRRWLREREGSYRGCRPPPEPRAAGDNPEVAVRLRRRLRAIDDDTLRRIVVMDGEGYNDREIAKATGLSRRAVEGRLSRFRAKGGRG